MEETKGRNRDEESMEPMRVSHAYDKDASGSAENLVNKKWGRAVLVLAALAVIFTLLPTRKRRPKIIDFACPDTVQKSFNDNDQHLTTDYLTDSGGETNVMNVTDFLENATFKGEEYDNWGHAYKEMKKGMYHWKSTMYPDNINEGDSIYESACGLGFNLYMTCEILNQVKGLERLVVYGNEYLAANAEKANALWDTAAPFRTTKGRICTADSTNLSHVPSNSFDLVFTGYITPVYNPLNLTNGTINDKYRIYRRYCESNNVEEQKLANLTQERQEDFYAAWVREMVRLAKPGKAVIVEQVSVPYCDNYLDWGGVRREWWEPSIDHYGWDVDPESLVIEKDSIYRNRYHVFMRKNS